MARYALILFDLDGTLVDSGQDVVDSELYALARMGLGSPGESWAMARLGMPLDELLGELLGRRPTPAEHEQFVHHYREHHYGHGYPSSRPFPEVPETLAALHPRHLLAVATTRPTAAAADLLGHVGLERWFARVQGTEPHQPHKPDPTILNLVIDELGVSRERALMVGDTARDVAAGRAAGIDTVLVTHGRPPQRPLPPDEGPSYTLTRFSELMAVVG